MFNELAHILRCHHDCLKLKTCCNLLLEELASRHRATMTHGDDHADPP